jgi:hypothetical protein
MYNLDLLLIVGQGQGPNAAVAGRVGVEQGQVKGPPDLHDAPVTAGQQVFAVAGHQNALKHHSFIMLGHFINLVFHQLGILSSCFSDNP